MATNEPIVMALPKGRILGEVRPLLERAGIEPEAEFDDAASRKLKFRTRDGAMELVLVRAFDVTTVVAFGAVYCIAFFSWSVASTC